MFTVMFSSDPTSTSATDMVGLAFFTSKSIMEYVDSKASSLYNATRVYFPASNFNDSSSSFV